MPGCSVIIPVHNRAALTQRCLTAVLAHPATGVETTIVVVDDASDDATARILAAYGDRLCVVTQPTIGGFATACNDGAATVADDYLVFLHNDALPQPGWLDALVDYAEAHPEAAVVGSKLLTSDGVIQHAGIAIGQDGQPRYLYAGFPAEHPAVNKSRPFQAVTTACALVRRAAFEQVGGFDTAFFSGAADLDLCLRIAAADREIHYCPDSALHHLGQLDAAFAGGAVGSPAARDAQLLRTRWAHRLQPDDVRYYVEDGLLTVDYATGYPLRLTVSPQLAVVEGVGREWQADRLLHARSRQVADALRDNARLTLRLDEQERDIQALARQLAEQLASRTAQQPEAKRT